MSTAARAASPEPATAASHDPAAAVPAPAPRESPSQPRDRLATAVKASPLLGLAACIALVVWGMRTGVLETQESLRAFIDSLGAWGATVFAVVSIASVVFPIVPGGLLVLAAPVLFGPVQGSLLNYVAVCTGSFLNFAIARHVGLDLVERLVPEKVVERYLGWTRSPRFTRLFALAIALPIAPDDLLCYLAGTTRMRWRTYATIILLCKPWSILAYGLGVSALIMRFLPW